MVILINSQFDRICSTRVLECSTVQQHGPGLMRNNHSGETMRPSSFVDNVEKCREASVGTERLFRADQIIVLNSWQDTVAVGIVCFITWEA